MKIEKDIKEVTLANGNIRAFRDITNNSVRIAFGETDKDFVTSLPELEMNIEAIKTVMKINSY